MTITPSELAKMFEEIEADRRPSPPIAPRYECDCGKVYSHPDLVHLCAHYGHKLGSP